MRFLLDLVIIEHVACCYYICLFCSLLIIHVTSMRPYHVHCVFFWFGLQMEELLKEVALSERRKKQMDSFIQQITDLLKSVPETPVVEVSTQCLELCTSETDFFILWFYSLKMFYVFWFSCQTCLGYQSRELMSRSSWFLRRLRASSTWSHLTLWTWLGVILWELALNLECLLIWLLQFLL